MFISFISRSIYLCFSTTMLVSDKIFKCNKCNKAFSCNAKLERYFRLFSDNKFFIDFSKLFMIIWFKQLKALCFFMSIRITCVSSHSRVTLSHIDLTLTRYYVTKHHAHALLCHETPRSRVTLSRDPPTYFLMSYLHVFFQAHARSLRCETLHM